MNYTLISNKKIDMIKRKKTKNSIVPIIGSLLLILTFNCCKDINTSKKPDVSQEKEVIDEHTLLTTTQLQEKYLIGNWVIDGHSNENPKSGLKFRVDGEITFMDNKSLDGIIGFKILEENKTLGLIACKVNATWLWTKDGSWDFNKDEPNSCDCTYESYDKSVPENKLKELSFCDFFIGDENLFGESNEFTKTKSSFYRDKLIISYKDYSKSLDFEMTLNRNK